MAEQPARVAVHQMAMANGNGKQIGVWVLSGLLTLMFLFAGGFKLSGAQTAIENFAKWGYPDWFRVFTGLVEVTAAVLVIIPRTTFYGAALIMATMIGAALTHATHDETRNIPLPLVLFALAAVLAYLRRPARWARSATSTSTGTAQST